MNDPNISAYRTIDDSSKPDFEMMDSKNEISNCFHNDDFEIKNSTELSNNMPEQHLTFNSDILSDYETSSKISNNILSMSDTVFIPESDSNGLLSNDMECSEMLQSHNDFFHQNINSQNIISHVNIAQSFNENDRIAKPIVDKIITDEVLNANNLEKDNMMETTVIEEIKNCLTDNENVHCNNSTSHSRVSIVNDLEDSIVNVESNSNVYIQSNEINDTTQNIKKETLRQDWTSKPKLCFNSINPTTKTQNNYLRGCLWSPDGTCLLTNSNDNIMRIYELPRDGYDKDLYNKDVAQTEIIPVLNVKELDLIYDYCWYPYMNSNNPDTCLFASTSRKGAVRLWDAYHGIERAYVQPYDHLVEPVSAHSIAFSRDGIKMYCGFNKCLRVYDISRLNSVPERRPRIGQKSELRGIISCIATSAVNIGMYGCGSFNKDAAIYHEQSGDQILEFLRTDNRVGGITHIEFSPVDMNLVATGGRIDDDIHMWDLRSMGSPIYSTMKRDVRTNQRIYFQFDSSGKYIVSGNHDGNVSVYDINGATSEKDDYLLPKIAEWSAHSDVCNGLSLHPLLPIVATASGQRRLTPPWLRTGMLQSTAVTDGSDDSDWSSDDSEEKSLLSPVQQNEVRLWRLDMVEEEQCQEGGLSV